MTEPGRHPIAIVFDESGAIRPLGKDEPVPMKPGLEPVRFPAIAELFQGDRIVEGAAEDDPRCARFIVVLESMAAEYCQALGRPITDLEFQRVFKQLKSKPDSADRNPLFSYLRAAAQGHMSRSPVSKLEYRAVVGRLARSAKTFRKGKKSTHYYDNVLARIDELNY